MLDKTQYQFTEDWFSGSLDVWKRIAESRIVRSALEIGSHEGRSAVWFIENFADLKRLVCVDPWTGSTYATVQQEKIEAAFDHNVAIAAARKPDLRLEKVRSASTPALASLICDGAVFDLIYIDGSHTAYDTLADACMAFHLLALGGTLVFDDYLWCPWKPGTQELTETPKIAIDAFLACFLRKLIFVEVDSMKVVVRKIAR